MNGTRLILRNLPDKSETISEGAKLRWENEQKIECKSFRRSASEKDYELNQRC